MNVPGVAAEELGGVILGSRNTEAIGPPRRAPPLVAVAYALAAPRRLPEIKACAVIRRVTCRASCATAARNEGTPCVVVHSLRVCAQPDGPPRTGPLAGVPAVHRRSAAVVRLRRSWSSFNAACVEWLAWRAARTPNPLRGRPSIGAARRCAASLLLAPRSGPRSMAATQPPFPHDRQRS